jgi:hypothetical protein
MAAVAAIVVIAGFATRTVTGYLQSRDPIYQCIGDPLFQPYQVSVPISVTKDGVPAIAPKGIGMAGQCTRPVHTLQENVIHVAYRELYQFTLGHFIYNWLGQDLSRYSTTVFVNGKQHTGGSFLDIPLRQGDAIRIEFMTR